MRVEAGADRRAADGKIVEAIERRSRRSISRSSSETQPEISWPTVSGVASCRCVRPILTTSANSLALASRRRASALTAGISALDLLGGGDVHRRRETCRSKTATC